MASLGPQPLLRHDGDGKLALQQEGVTLLQKAGAPVHVVFAIGGSRCGKSTAGNSLIFGPDPLGRGGFETGGSFDPVTNGVDVAIRRLPGGGTLIVGDCEGAFHICGSSQSARGFGSLGMLAYHLSSTLLHVSMGSIDERDVEVLGHLAAAAGEITTVDASSGPSLLLLVNGARFDLGDAVARKLLRPQTDEPSAARHCARAAIARAFRGQPSLEALPACSHDAYWPKVDALRERLLESAPVMLPSGLQASGSDLSKRLTDFVGRLNNEGKVASALRDPEPASEVLLRNNHLEPLVEEISKKFVNEGASWTRNKMLTPSKEDVSKESVTVTIEDALSEFDRRSAWLLDGRGTDGPRIRKDVVQRVRERLHSRLTGIHEALLRGREQALASTTTTWPDGQSEPGTPARSSYTGKETRTPTPPSTPGCKRRSIAAVKSSLDEAELRLDQLQQSVRQQLRDIKASFTATVGMVENDTSSTLQSEQKASAAFRSMQDEWQLCLQDASNQREGSIRAQAAASVKSLSTAEIALRDVKAMLPDLAVIPSHLGDVRALLEDMREKRRHASDAASSALTKHLLELSDLWEEEASSSLLLRDVVSKRLAEETNTLHACLQEERLMRLERHNALAEVVERMRRSLEALEVDDSQVFSTSNSFQAELTPPTVRRHRSPAMRVPSLPSRRWH